MSFLDDFSRKYLDASEVDAIRTLRPCGPLDDLILTLECASCHEKKKESLRWFQLNDFACPCGGMFDDKPLRHAIVNMTVDYLMKTKTPEQIMEIIEDRHRDDAR